MFIYPTYNSILLEDSLRDVVLLNRQAAVLEGPPGERPRVALKIWEWPLP